jgi:hypothetical protein
VDLNPWLTKLADQRIDRREAGVKKWRAGGVRSING